MGRKAEGPSTLELLLRLPQQIISLIRAEYENAKIEIMRAVKKFTIGAIFLVIALFFLFWAVAALGFSGGAALSLVWPVWLSALTIGVALILLAVAAVVTGLMLIRRGNPVPEETLGRVSDDVAVATNVRYNQHENLARERVAEREEQQ